MPKQREKMTEVHSCGSPPFSTCLGAVASFIISQGQKCHKKPFPLVYYQSHKEKSVKGGHRPQRLPLILFFVGYNAGGENGCPSVSLLVGIISVIVGVALKMNNNAMEKEKREQESCTSCAYRKDWYCPVAGDRVKREGHCSEYEKSEIAKEK